MKNNRMLHIISAAGGRRTSRKALELCDGFIRLPAFGQKNSINVGNCAAVVLFDCVRRTNS